MFTVQYGLGLKTATILSLKGLTAAMVVLRAEHHLIPGKDAIHSTAKSRPTLVPVLFLQWQSGWRLTTHLHLMLSLRCVALKTSS